MFLGGLELDGDGFVRKVGALQTIYTLQARSEAQVAASKAWEERLERFVFEEAEPKYKNVRVLVRTEQLIDKWADHGGNFYLLHCAIFNRAPSENK